MGNPNSSSRTEVTTLASENLAKRFGRRLLFRELSFSISSGTALAVTGANGSGKSTLMRIIAGLMTPNKGGVVFKVEGEAVTDEDRPLKTGFVAPYLDVYDGFSARENLAFVAKVRRLSRPAERVDEVLQQVGLGKRGNDRVKTFSSGMKQRVKVATALITNPPLLLLDEPSTNLDEAGIEMIKSVIADQKEKGGIVVLATNSPNELSWCDSSLRIEDYRT